MALRMVFRQAAFANIHDCYFTISTPANRPSRWHRHARRQPKYLIDHCTVVGIGNAAIYVNNDWGSSSGITVTTACCVVHKGGCNITVFVDQKSGKFGIISGITIKDCLIQKGYYTYAHHQRAEYLDEQSRLLNRRAYSRAVTLTTE